MNNRNYDELAKAIVEQAVKDYTFNVNKLLKLMDKEADLEEIETQARIVKGLEKFFRSEWYECLTNMDGDRLLRTIKQELGLIEKPYRKPVVIVKEVLAADVCPKDCVYLSFHKTCDYCAIEEELRGCDLGRDCIRYKKRNGPKKVKSQSIGVIPHTSQEDRDFYEFKRGLINNAVGKSHRRRVK